MSESSPPPFRPQLDQPSGPDFAQPAAPTYGPPPSDATWAPVPTGQAPTPAYAPTGELVLNLRKPFGAMGMITPLVSIDGYPVRVGWGRTVVPAPAGVRQVSAASSYLWTYGRADLPVAVEPGRSTEVFYAGPYVTFMGGAMGLTPQRKPGTTVLVVLLSVLGLLVLLSVLGGFLSS